MDDGSDVAFGLFAVAGLVLAIVWLVSWRRQLAEGKRPMRGIPVEAELLDATPAAAGRWADDPPRLPSGDAGPPARRCRICQHGSPGGTWHRPQYIASDGGLAGPASGAWRRWRGLPPRYSREVLVDAADDVCASCHVSRNKRLDRLIEETRIQYLELDERVARRHQEAVAHLDDEMRNELGRGSVVKW